MDKPKKSQILKLSPIVALLIITPLVPTSLRPAYLYFVFNLLILALGAESGLLSFFSKTKEDKKPPASPPDMAAKPVVASDQSSPLKEAGPANAANRAITAENCNENKPNKVVEKCSSEKIVGGAAKVHRVKKCPSTPSLFFIGGGETETEPEELIEDVEDEEEEEEEEEEADGLSGQELFTKAEIFIGNFYKQLKTQREESWKRIHGLY